MAHGMEVPPSMGVSTAINFQPTGGGKAAITGDFVITAAEVNPVIRALRDHAGRGAARRARQTGATGALSAASRGEPVVRRVKRTS